MKRSYLDNVRLGQLFIHLSLCSMKGVRNLLGPRATSILLFRQTEELEPPTLLLKSHIASFYFLVNHLQLLIFLINCYYQD